MRLPRALESEVSDISLWLGRGKPDRSMERFSAQQADALRDGIAQFR